MTLEEYKKAFISYIVEHCKNYNNGIYDSKDEEWFNKLANDEYEAQLENIDEDDLVLGDPESDAHECISCWE